jgi:hypothetical protein
MGKRQEETTKPQIVMRRYSDEELQKFHDKIQKYYEDYTDRKNQTFKVLNKKKLMIAFEALTPSGAVAYDEVEDRATRYLDFENIFEQWQSWKWRTGLDTRSGGHEKLEQLDKIAEEMRVEPVPEPSDLDF